MTLTVPYSFVPGTKAKAQEVNANFVAILDQLEETNDTKLNKDFTNISTKGIEYIKNNISYRNVGELIFSSIPLTDSGLHLLDGSLITNSGIYTDFIKYIKKLNDNANSENIFTTETEWQTSVTKYGSCGKFVYDPVNNTVRLPKITGIIEGTTDISTLGDLVEAGLPNITGSTNNIALMESQGRSTGAITQTRQSLGSYGHYQTNWIHEFKQINLDASLSSSIYGNSNTVQPQTIKQFVYIVIATFAKTDIQVDIDEVATDLNGKVDKDLTNMNPGQSAKNTIIGWMLPDYDNAITFNYTTSSYTVPRAGYFGIVSSPLGSSQNTGLKVYINGVKIVDMDNPVNNWTRFASGLYPVSAGDVITQTDSTSPGPDFIFIPMKGVN